MVRTVPGKIFEFAKSNLKVFPAAMAGSGRESALRL
jgi:hypothetical protein